MVKSREASKTSRPARIALMGAGMIGREHAMLCRDHRDIELVGMADPAPGTRDVANEMGVPHFADFTDILDAVEPDAVIVALPNALHAPAAVECLERGIPCLLEKPIAESIVAANAIVEASDRTGVPVLVGHHRRHSPDICAARQSIRSGDLGPVVAVNGMAIFDKPESYFEAEWRRRPGGGPLLINLIHDIDVLRFLVGEIAEVRAITSSATRNFEVEDTASVSIAFENGALGSFTVSDAAVSPWNWEYTSGQALYFPTQPGAYLFIAGRRAALSVSDMYLWRHPTAEGHWQDPLIREYRQPARESAYVRQLNHFLEVIARRAEPVVSARDGRATLAAILAVDRAAREGRPVKVAEILGE